MRILRIFARFAVVGAILAALAVPMSSGAATPLSEDALLDLNQDWSLPHEGRPMGVPEAFGWARKAFLEAGNEPGQFKTLTGWGHVFWDKEELGHPGPIEIRNFHTFLCSGPERGWSLAQRGLIEGAQFRADFQGNAAKRPVRLSVEGNTSNVLFDAGSTFHFWPASGRHRLPSRDICGVVVLLEARAAAPPARAFSKRAGGYLIGLGADYWIDMTSPWEHFKTNKGVALGRMKRVGREWAWYGMSTAADASGLLNFDR